MKSSTSLVVALAAGLMAVTPALAQSNNDTSKHSTTMGATKKPTQGAPVGSTPQQYGTTAKKQPTAGTPAGYDPTHYGSAQAKKSE